VEHLRQGDLAQRRRVDESLDRRRRLAKGEDADQDAEAEEQRVDPPGRHGHHRSAGAVAADDKADPQHQAADDLRQQIGRAEVDQRQVDQAGPGEIEETQHGGDDGREHHFEHRQVRQVELRRELAGAAEAGALEKEAEAEADDHGHHQRDLVAEETELEERRVHVHCLRTNQAVA
jgi:hypothetical protein